MTFDGARITGLASALAAPGDEWMAFEVDVRTGIAQGGGWTENVDFSLIKDPEQLAPGVERPRPAVEHPSESKSRPSGVDLDVQALIAPTQMHAITSVAGLFAFVLLGMGISRGWPGMRVVGDLLLWSGVFGLAAGGRVMSGRLFDARDWGRTVGWVLHGISVVLAGLSAGATRSAVDVRLLGVLLASAVLGLGQALLAVRRIRRVRGGS